VEKRFAVVVAISLLFTQLVWSAEKPADQLFPPETVGIVIIPNMNELKTRWERTELGKLFADPAMEPFRTELQKQLEARNVGLKARLGLSPTELQSLPSGEAALGMVPLGKGKYGLLLTADVTGRIKQTQEVLRKVAESLKAQGAEEKIQTLSGTQVTIHTLPAGKDGRGGRPILYCIAGNLLILSDHPLAVERALSARLESLPSLAQAEGYQAVFGRCQSDGAQPAQIRWFIRPLEYLEGIRSYIPPDQRRRESWVGRLRAAGFESLKAIGGNFHLAEGDFQILHRMMVYAPRPLEKSAKMLNFPNTQELNPPDWIPREVAGLTCISCNIQEAFEHVGPIFDQIVGEGEEGVWEDVLDSLKNDPEGPQIDLRTELIAYLGQRVMMISSYEEPVGPQSERLLFAIEVRDPERVAQALRKTLESDKEIERRQLGNLVIWETVRKQPEAVRSVRLEMPTLPGRGSAPAEEETTSSPLLPNAAITVANDYLLIASHYDFLVRMLRPIETRNALVRSVDWLLVDETLAAMRGEEGCLRIFYRADQTYRPTYELIRQGRMPESESLLGRFLNTLLSEEDGDGIRKQRIDGSKLPDFEVVRRHLGLVGVYGRTDPNGWFIKAFMLNPAIPK
jgi:hypothetical protein